MKKTKLLKSILIPIVGTATISGIAVMPTSCNGSLSIIGGSYDVYGYKGVPQQAEDTWKINDVTGGLIPADQVTWSLSKEIQGLHIEKGTVYWDKDIAIDNYVFFVQGLYNGQIVRTKKLVKLNILSELKVSDGTTYITMSKDSEFVDEDHPWKFYEINNKAEQKEITSSIKWSISSSDHLVQEHVSLDEKNCVHVSSYGIDKGDYKFSVRVEYTTENQTLHINSDEINLTVTE